jgi:transcriptional regulator with GAF, ATPase, and Fis domain
MAEPARTTTRLVFIANADAPELPSSSHALDDVDEVRFGRGERLFERTEIDGARVLVVRLPDDRMSTNHGTLRRKDARWVLDDPASKNGAVVAGVATRHAALRDGSVVELGHSFFVLRDSRSPSPLAPDVDARDLVGRPAGMATFCPPLARELDELARVAASPISIIVLGETGTGKEVVARAIHELSKRTGELVAVNCGGLPPTLLESELFGYKRGAFSGAIADRKGLIRSADGGTLFLDEIGELPMTAQAALLRVLQEREVLPVGADHAVAVDLRVVVATLRDLEQAIADDAFRDDLYARLNGYTIVLPPLRDRREDFGLLLAAIVPRLAQRPMRIAPLALRAMLQYDWPHNIRELEQVLATAVAIADDRIEFEHLRAKVRRPPSSSPRDDSPAAQAAASAPVPELDADDRQLRDQLVELLTAHAGNVMTVAEVLGKRRTQIYKWVKRFGIELGAFRR